MDKKKMRNKIEGDENLIWVNESDERAHFESKIIFLCLPFLIFF
jgi:hypothetical protein